MPLINKIPTISSGDYKNYNAYFDETPGRAAVQYKLNPKMVISEEGVFRTILGNLTRDLPYADYTSAYVNTFIDYTFKNNPSYNTQEGYIRTKNGGVMHLETPQGETNPLYKSQPTFLMAFPGRDTLALDPKTKMLTNTRVVTQGGMTANNKTNNTQPTNPNTRRTASMGTETLQGSVRGGGY